MTHKPSRLRRWLKWVGLVASTAVLVVWVLGYWYDVTYTGATWVVGFGRGYTGAAWGPEFRPHGWSVEPAGELYAWPPVVWSRQHVMFPLWIPLALFALPSAYLWYRDRRPPAGHCQACGYNLTGNESGTCPECGEPT